MSLTRINKLGMKRHWHAWWPFLLAGTISEASMIAFDVYTWRTYVVTLIALAAGSGASTATHALRRPDGDTGVSER